MTSIPATFRELLKTFVGKSVVIQTRFNGGNINGKEVTNLPEGILIFEDRNGPCAINYSGVIIGISKFSVELQLTSNVSVNIPIENIFYFSDATHCGYRSSNRLSYIPFTFNITEGLQSKGYILDVTNEYFIWYESYTCPVLYVPYKIEGKQTIEFKLIRKEE